jgi:hypothetical protein
MADFRWAGKIPASTIPKITFFFEVLANYYFLSIKKKNFNEKICIAYSGKRHKTAFLGLEECKLKI